METAEGGELLDNLAFGVAEGGGGDGEEESFSIPTLDTTVVIVGILLLLALGGFTLRAQQRLTSLRRRRPFHIPGGPGAAGVVLRRAFLGDY